MKIEIARDINSENSNSTAGRGGKEEGSHVNT